MRFNSPSTFSWRFFSSLGGSFVAGVACAILIVSPGLMQSNNDGLPVMISGDQEQIVMRGPNDTEDNFPNSYVQQNDSRIVHGGVIRANEDLMLAFKAPISGTYKISEIIDQENPFALTGEIQKGLYLPMPKFKVGDQDTLTLRVEISNDVTSITQHLVFKVVQ